jgi:outer membrane protein assembly factor BamD (BamD/ComL family)
MRIVFCALLAIILGYSASIQAAFTIKNGWIVDAAEVATLSVQEHFSLGLRAMESAHWQEAAKQFRIVSVNFSSTPYGQEANYYLGIAYFYLEEYDFADESFTQYLKAVNNPKFFQETVEYKFAIAEKFKNGAKRRFFGTRKLPKWASGQSNALKIYDEVVATVPSHEMAAKALAAKGRLLWSLKEYREAVDAFQLVIKRFPKHELAPECYLLITKVYLEQCKHEFQNPDLLAFAEINLRKFKHDFPREEHLKEAEADVMAIKEVYAQGLYDTGQFYERISRPRASVIYYQSAINQFPDTMIANLCRQRLEVLCPRS